MTTTNKILLKDLLSSSDVEVNDFKIHCATGKLNPPLEAFLNNDFKAWQEFQNKPNFKCSQILSLILLKPNEWLFAGIFNVKGVETKNVKGKHRYIYRTSEVAGLEHLVGRVKLFFEKNFRASYLKGGKYFDKLVVSEILPKRMTIGSFPGFNSVLISNYLLQAIVRERNLSWHTALSNVSGVYIITDNETGKLYIGSAYGGEGIWQRWESYAKSGHGGNKELRQVLKQHGNDYVSNFQYSILEVCDLNASDDYVISRECHWKEVMKSREFGYNIN